MIPSSEAQQVTGGQPAAPKRRRRALMPRLAAALFLAGALLGLLAFAVFSPDNANTTALLVTAGFALAIAATLWFAGAHIPPSMYGMFGFAGTALITSTIYFWGNATNVYVIYYLWVVLYTCYFFSRREAIAQLAFIAAAYALVLWKRPPSGNAVEAWVLSIGTLTVAGLVIVSLRERVNRLVARLSSAARTDDLTGLMNRRGFYEQLDDEIAVAAEQHKHFSLVLGDIDRFKEVNDRFGHQLGDQILVGLSALITAVDADMRTARVGGEEFALLIRDCDCDRALGIAEHLRDEVKEAYRKQPVPLTISFGIASYGSHGTTARDLFQAADQALYAAKALGRDRSVVHSDEIAGTLGAGTHDAQDEMRLATVLALAEAMDVRDSGTAKHSQTVGQYAEMTARELNLDPDLVERIRLAGILHDVGKVGVPDSVLRKPGPLTDPEWEVMKKHPEIGARILEGADFEDIREWVLAHQERPDGRGYPQALRGDEIPLPARVLAVADAYEAMTADRVYRRAMSHEKAQSELQRCAGTQFDPQVVDAFVRALARHRDRQGATAP